MRLKLVRYLFPVVLFGMCIPAARGADITVPVVALPSPPAIGGDDKVWSLLQQRLTPIPTHPSAGGEDEAATAGDTWAPDLKIAAGIHADGVFFLAEWSDEKAGTTYRPWQRLRDRYTRSRERDDMLAMRFQMGADFDVCMLSRTTYHVDMWHWTAGRSNLVGIADDMSTRFSISPLTPAVEYPIAGGTVYIQRTYDDGDDGRENVRTPTERTENVIPSVVALGKPGGSRADVAANGRWLDGRWMVRFSRRLNTGDPGDVVFEKGSKQVMQIAVFNSGYTMRKHISDEIHLDFSELR
ncbi:MAG: ethylbenzene dehydrogenase-related protein [Alphaproteobacteria bacterium]